MKKYFIVLTFRFGCGAKGSQTGIIFNNALTDFHRKNSAMDKDPEFHANFLQRGKMAGSMRAPVLVTNTEGNTVLTLGASGGVRIPTAIVQVSGIFHNAQLSVTMACKKTTVLSKKITFPGPIFTDIDVHSILLF